MRKQTFRTIDEVLGAELNISCAATETTDRVLKSTRLEDKIYAELRDGDEFMDAVNADCAQKLPTFGALSRDVFQSMYSLNVRRNDAETLSSTSQQFNTHILDSVMTGDDYPTIKTVCEGRQLPAYEAASEFIENVSSNIDALLESAGGNKNLMNTLEKLTRQESELQQKLAELLENRSEDNPQQDAEIVNAANKAAGKSQQVQVVGELIQSSLLINSAAVNKVISQAVSASREKAEDTALALAAWGDDGGDGDSKMELDRAVISRVHQSDTLREVTKYLGRFKEMAANARKNGYAYGRGEKYTLEQGRDLSRVITAGFALLAVPETIPLFLRKYQGGKLPQYKRREQVFKGSGDIIMCLDESDSTKAEAAWGKAVALTLLDAAMRGNRKFALIHFSGLDSYKTDVFRPGEYSQEEVYASAETFLKGGTNFETPLTEALRLMEQEDFENADIVFTTDGECALPDIFIEELQLKKTELNFKITGVLLDEESPSMDFSLTPFCDAVLRTSVLARDRIAQVLVTSRV